MKTLERTLAELPGRAEFGGYVYVIKFGNDMIKVGRTKDARSRVSGHRKDARTFGTSLARWWVSPLHDGWLENEEALKSLAHELGGTPVSPEYFNGVSFDDLLAKACELPFPAVDVAEALQAEAAARCVPEWPDADLDRCRVLIRYGDISEQTATEDLADLIIRSKPAFARSLVERFRPGSPHHRRRGRPARRRRVVTASYSTRDRCEYPSLAECLQAAAEALADALAEQARGGAGTRQGAA